MVILGLTDEELAVATGGSVVDPVGRPWLAGLPDDRVQLAMACGLRSLTARGLLSAGPGEGARAGADADAGREPPEGRLVSLRGMLADVVRLRRPTALAVTAEGRRPGDASSAWCVAAWPDRGRWLVEQVDESGIHLFTFADHAQGGRLLCDALVPDDAASAPSGMAVVRARWPDADQAWEPVRAARERATVVGRLALAPTGVAGAARRLGPQLDGGGGAAAGAEDPAAGAASGIAVVIALVVVPEVVWWCTNGAAPDELVAEPLTRVEVRERLAQTLGRLRAAA